LPLDQVRKIVDSISEVVGTDVCTLYMVDENKDMVLIASHGLRDNNFIKIPAGKGLVGLVAQSRHPINLAVAARHPNFYYVAETEEERFQSFCGVPLVRYGEVIGVLVVQRAEATALSIEDEAFLVTLSSQLALIVDDIPLDRNLTAPSNIRIAGVRGSSGIGIGQVVFYDHGDLYSVPDSPVENVEFALREWQQLLDDVKQEILQEKAALGDQLSNSIASIFNSYYTLLGDRTLSEKVEKEIRNGNWLPGALRKGIHFFSDLFSAMDDPYLKARQEDIHHLGNKLYNAYQGRSQQEQSLTLPAGQVVLVGDQISVSDMASIPVEKIAGVVCFQGSSMSHTAVLANALGVPAVMGVGILKHISRTERLIVDGNVGQVLRYPTDMLCAEFQRLIDEEKQL
ncbi:MAG: phosphoenolpyruvate-utilizing N-terminal domain-containing protein, partial [Pseudohongiellaceae bacterium]